MQITTAKKTINLDQKLIRKVQKFTNRNSSQNTKTPI